MADDHPLARFVLDDIPWLQYPVRRMIFALAFQDFTVPRRDTRLAVFINRVLKRFPDERVPEDCHQKVRDRQ